MRQITEEQGLALIKKFQIESYSNLSIHDDETFGFMEEMRDHEYAYLFEASITEPYAEGADRLSKLLQVLKPEIDALGKAPQYFNFQILATKDASIHMSEMDAMQDFIDAYEDIKIVWSLHTIEDKAHTIKMQIITVTR